jgi:hypothetical protein
MNENTPKDTILQSLEISRNESYESNPGMYKGKVTYVARGSSVTIALDERVSQNLLAFLGPVLVEASAGLAHQITHCLQTSIGGIEKRKEIEVIASTKTEEPESHSPV